MNADDPILRAHYREWFKQIEDELNRRWGSWVFEQPIPNKPVTIGELPPDDEDISW